MKILFIGPKRSLNKGYSNSYLQFKTLKKLYRDVDSIDSSKILFLPSLTGKIFIHISPYILEYFINFYILSRVKKGYDLIWVKGGNFIGKKLILELKKKLRKLFLFVMITLLSKEIKKGGNYFYPRQNTMTV